MDAAPQLPQTSPEANQTQLAMPTPQALPQQVFVPPIQQAPPPLPQPAVGAPSQHLLQAPQVLQTPQQQPATADSFLPTGAMTPTGRSSSRHLAEWMASTERELRELKWLFGASVARVDGQHTRLMQELDKLRSQVDVWAEDSNSALGTSGSGPGAAGLDESKL